MEESAGQCFLLPSLDWHCNSGPVTVLPLPSSTRLTAVNSSVHLAPDYGAQRLRRHRLSFSDRLGHLFAAAASDLSLHIPLQFLVYVLIAQFCGFGLGNCTPKHDESSP